MTKKLFIIRHAKSSWDDIWLDDIERPLSNRGLKNGLAMAKFFNEEFCPIDLLVSSPARRAMETAEIFAKEIKYSLGNILREDKIYEADVHTLYNVIRKIDNSYNKVALFGHNPGLTNFVNAFTGSEINNIPTCGVVYIETNCEQWKDIEENKGDLISFDTPKGRKD